MKISGCDKFLGVLTSTRSLPFDGANGVFSIIDATIRGQDIVARTKWDYWEWLSDMEEQGFLRIDRRKKKVFIETPFTCRSITNQREVYLCGARTPEFLNELDSTSQQQGVVFNAEQLGFSFPSRISIKGNIKKIQKFVENFGLPFSKTPIAYQIAIKEVKRSDLIDENQLQNSINIEMSFSSIRNAFDRLSTLFHNTDIFLPGSEISFFNPVSLKYDGNPPTKENPCVLGKRNYQGIHDNLYRLAENGSIQVCPDISKQFAKYYCLSIGKCKLGYNDQRQAVIVPKYCRLPLSLARALTLCQCLPPRDVFLTYEDRVKLGLEKSSQEFLEYRGVPEVIRKLIETRLDMSFCDINYQEDKLLWKTQ